MVGYPPSRLTPKRLWTRVMGVQLKIPGSAPYMAVSSPRAYTSGPVSAVTHAWLYTGPPLSPLLKQPAQHVVAVGARAWCWPKSS